MSTEDNETHTSVCSDDTPVFCLPRTVSISVILGTISLVTVIGNILVIASYIRDWRIRSSVANMFILNLSICDLIVGAVSLPLDAAAVVMGRWFLGKVPCQIWLVLDYIATNVAAFTILFISLDRYWLLTKKLAYGTFQTHKRAATMIVISWTISLLFYTVLTFAWGPLAGVENVDYNVNCKLETYDNALYNACSFVVEFAIPLLITSYLNAMVYINIRRRSKGMSFKVQIASAKLSRSPGEIAGSERDQKDIALELTPKGQGIGHSFAQSLSEEPSARKELELDGGAFSNPGFEERIGGTDPRIQTNASDEQRTDAGPSEPEGPLPRSSGRCRTHEVREFRRHRKAAVTLSVLVIVFAISWFPFYVTSVIKALCGDCVSHLAWDVANYVLWINSTLNPFLYALLVVRFRENILHFLCFRTCRNRNGRK